MLDQDNTPPEREVWVLDGVGELPQALLEVVTRHVHGGRGVHARCNVREGRLRRGGGGKK